MSLKEFVFDAAARSISAHNVQPFRLRWISEERFEVLGDRARLLPAADPHLKDLRMSAGALFETLRLSLTTKAVALSVESLKENPDLSLPFFPVLCLRLSPQPGLAADPLATQLPRRFSYRGAFQGKPATPPPAHLDLDDLRLVFLSDNGKKNDLAKLFDRVNMKFLSLPGYVEELHSWMRFSPAHPRWSRDGLNAESMALSGLETWGASVVMKPGVFSALNSLGLATALVAEGPKIRSASTVVALTGPRRGPFEAGREFLRGWLALTGLDLFGAPLSLLTDDKDALVAVKDLFGVPASSEVYNVLRVGPLPSGYRVPAPARRERAELELPEGA